MRRTRSAGMAGFIGVWIGQAISLLGSGMSWFAFTVWAWRETGQATPLALVGFFSFGSTVLLSPLAGALVDRWNRKLVMMLSDLGTGLATIAVLVLYLTDRLEVWHLYGLGAFAGAFQAFQLPAYLAAVTTMLPKQHFGRAEAVIGLAKSASGILAPILAGFLLPIIDVSGIMAIDIATFVIAIAALALVSVPQPAPSAAGKEARGGLWKESLYGFRYMAARPGLLALQLITTGGSLLDYAGYVVLAPMILARSADNASTLGSVQSAAAIGAVVGGVLMAVWGGPRRRIHGVLLGWALAGVLGLSLLGLGRGLVVWAAASFMYAFFTPIINGCEQAIWQVKVAPDVQGRVFGTQSLVSNLAVSLGMLLAGPLADHVFEPAMLSGGGLAGSLGGLVGTGLGAGMALMLVLFGLLEMVLGGAGYFFRAVRDVEELLPDYDSAMHQVELVA